MLKKVSIVLFIISFVTSLKAHTQTIINRTQESLFVQFDTVFGIKAEGLVLPGQTVPFDVGGWCITKVWVSGKSGSIAGLETSIDVPAIENVCSGHRYFIFSYIQDPAKPPILKISGSWELPAEASARKKQGIWTEQPLLIPGFYLYR